MVRPAYVPDRGDVVWLSFDPTLGHEQAGHRPALILSPRLYNARSGLAIACPITTHVKGYPFEVEVEVPGVAGAVLADQVRTIDWRARQARLIARVGLPVITEVQQKLLSLID